jgi:hypothetical protein
MSPKCKDSKGQPAGEIGRDRQRPDLLPKSRVTDQQVSSSDQGCSLWPSPPLPHGLPLPLGQVATTRHVRATAATAPIERRAPYRCALYVG